MKQLLAALLLTISSTAFADNDDLAFDFVSAEPSTLIAVDECAERGIYTVNQGSKVKTNELIYDFNIDDFDNIGDFCQQAYDEIYPREFKANKIIRGILK